jgi:2'-5' RNA ligase
MQGAFEFYEDLPARPKRPERLFFGVFPDTETSIRVGRFGEQFIRERCLKGRPLRAERLHVSLHHVGDYKRLQTKFLYAAKQAGTAVSMRRFEVTFRFIESFEGPPPTDARPYRRPLVLLGESDALLELHRVLGAAMERSGLRAAEDFTPHMTMFYGAKPIARQAIEPFRFVVREFALIHSELWRTRYNVIGRWPLGGRISAPGL